MSRSAFLAVSLVWAILCLIPGRIAAQDEAALVSGANGALRSAQSAMFNGKTDEAAQLLDKAAGLVAQLEKANPANTQLPALKQKVGKQKADLARRSGAGTPAAPAVAAKTGATGSAAPAEGGKLPGGVTHRMESIEAALAKATEVLRKEGVASTDWKKEAANGHLAEARGVLADIEKAYGAQIPTDHPRMREIRARIAATEKEVAGLGQTMTAADADKKAQAQQRETQADEWLARFKPYVDFYGEKRLLVEPTGNAANLKGQTIYRDEAAALLEAYGKEEFPQGRTDELEQAAAKLGDAIKGFAANYEKSLAGVLDEPRAELGRWEQDLGEKLKTDAAALPIDSEQLDRARRRAEGLGDVLPPGAPEIKELHARIAAVEAKNAELRKRWVANTLMKADAYAGADAASLKTIAGAIVRKAHGDASILRTTITKDAWSEERETEWTDTTRTALRHRITRFLTAQVAARQGKDTLLHTLHLAQDRKADNTWGETYGHIMFSDAMLEANVKRTAP